MIHTYCCIVNSVVRFKWSYVLNLRVKYIYIYTHKGPYKLMVKLMVRMLSVSLPNKAFWVVFDIFLLFIL